MKFVSLLFAAMLLAALGASAQTSNDSSDAKIQGQQLVQELLEQTLTTNSTEKATLKTRSSAGSTIETPVTLTTLPIDGGWVVSYSAIETNGPGSTITLKIVHRIGLPNQYLESKTPRAIQDDSLLLNLLHPDNLTGSQTMTPFAGSDFWIADLGLEFFHWPDQKIIKHESRRTRACAVLESTNPHPAPGAYSRVDSWIDNETLEIVHAEAYDANGKLLKVFDPKSLKKINGHWELQEMEIQNVQTHSRTWIKFDLRG